MGKQAPAPQNFKGAAEDQSAAAQRNINTQTQANRPGQSTDFANVRWTQGPDGQWQQNSSLNGPLGAAAGAAQQQAAAALGKPLDFSGLGQVDDGSHARDQAIQAAYGQATSRLDPQWAQRQEEQGAQLANQGLDPSSQAYRTAMQQFGQQRNDAYGGAMNSAIGQGTAAGQAAFQQSMAGRQQQLSEILRQRQQPLDELHSLQGFQAMPGFANAGAAEGPQYLGAAVAQGNADMDAYKLQRDQWKDYLSAGGQVAGAAARAAFGGM